MFRISGQSCAWILGHEVKGHLTQDLHKISRNVRVRLMRTGSRSNAESEAELATRFKRATQGSQKGSPRLGSSKSGGLLLLIIPVSAFCLGVWQVYRWRWKVQLIQEMESKVGAQTVNFPFDNLEELKNLEYKKVGLRGSFDSSKELLIGPRSLIGSSGDVPSKGLISHGSGSPGYYVVTPFKLAEQNLTILVNRGWIPSKNLSQFKAGTQEVDIVGVVRNTEQRSPFMSKNIPTKGLWLFRDIPAMAEQLQTSEVFLDLSSVSGGSLKEDFVPVPGQTRVTLRNEHVNYFVTWFSLAGITGYMWHRIFVRRKPFR